MGNSMVSDPLNPESVIPFGTMLENFQKGLYPDVTGVNFCTNCDSLDSAVQDRCQIFAPTAEGKFHFLRRKIIWICQGQGRVVFEK